MADRAPSYSVKLSPEFYARVAAAAKAEGRLISATLERMCNGANVEKVAIVDEWLDMTALNEVQRRWRNVTRKNARLDGR